MMKQIEAHGQRIKLYSSDGGCTWSSSPRSIVAYERRKKMLLSELQKRFERIEARQDREPNNLSQFKIPKSLRKAQVKTS